MIVDEPKSRRALTCAECWKLPAFCLCEETSAQHPRTRVLILQHPQESKSDYGTGRLLCLCLEGSGFRIGLSWQSLSHALGEKVDPKEWAVLFAGAKKEAPGDQSL